MEITKLKGVQKEIDSNFNNIIPESQSNRHVQNGGTDSFAMIILLLRFKIKPNVRIKIDRTCI